MLDYWRDEGRVSTGDPCFNNWETFFEYWPYFVIKIVDHFIWTCSTTDNIFSLLCSLKSRNSTVFLMTLTLTTGLSKTLQGEFMDISSLIREIPPILGSQIDPRFG